MKSNLKFFKKSKILPVDSFFMNVLYDKKFGYYNSHYPFGERGDYITSPKISNLFSEIISVWLINSWELFGKPKIFNIVELGPGDGSLTKSLLKTFKRFPEFDASKKIFLYEVSNFLMNIQKKVFPNKEVKWIKNFSEIKKGPVIFFGNEFFDAIPIKQFRKIKNSYVEKNYFINQNFKIKEKFKKTSYYNVRLIESYNTLNKLKFIELPKLGLRELEKMTKKINKLKGCILMIDYGYLEPNNQNTLQSVMKHKKNYLLNNLGKADITSHVNFALLREFFLKKNLNIKKVITQKEFLENMGILYRAKVLAKKMKFSDKANLYLRLKRLLSPRSMGSLFKVILAYKFKNNKFAGFE